jgi:hypothetical protein
MQKEQEVIYKVTVTYRDPFEKQLVILCEAFGPMEGSVMVAFYKQGNADNIPDVMINEECIKSMETVRMMKK